MKTYTLEGSRIQDMETFYNEVTTVFSLPEHFGRNLDALYDCISGRSDDVLLIRGFDGLEERIGDHLPDIMEVFSGAEMEVVLEYGF